MAPARKATPARVALSTLAQPVKPTPNKQQANLHTMEITVDNIVLDGPAGEEYRAVRAVVADGNSVVAGAPVKFHGLNTFTPRAMEQFTLPTAPAKDGVIEAACGMLPPETSKNPYQHISWIWMLVGYSTKKTGAKSAADFVAKKLVAVMKASMLECDIRVPAVPGKSPWSASAEIDGNRVKMVRSGTKLDGGTYEITELFNFTVRLATDLSPGVRAVMKTFATKYSKVMAVVDVSPSTAFPCMAAASPSSSKQSNVAAKAKTKAKAKAKSKSVAKTKKTAMKSKRT